MAHDLRDEKPSPARPYFVHVTWIEGSTKTYEVRQHVVDSNDSMTVWLNDRKFREVLIPFSNVKEIEIEK